MKIVIVEDELPNSKLLQSMLKTIKPEWNDITALQSVHESVAWFKVNPQPDLIFMDIQLTDGVSFSIFEQVKIQSMVIFTTAYNQYAIQAFKVNSLDYLLKPIKKEELERALDKFELAYKLIVEKNEAKPAADFTDIIKAIRDGEKKYKERFLIAGIQDYFKVDIKNVAFFYTKNRITYLVTFDGKEHIIDYTMEKLEEVLNPECFFRANRSHILGIECVRKFENYFGGKLMVKLVAPFKHRVEISRLKASDFKQWMDA